jgi:hypothetical protein
MEIHIVWVVALQRILNINDEMMNIRRTYNNMHYSILRNN